MMDEETKAEKEDGEAEKLGVTQGGCGHLASDTRCFIGKPPHPPPAPPRLFIRTQHWM